MSEGLKILSTVVAFIVFILVFPWIGMGIGEYFIWVWNFAK